MTDPLNDAVRKIKIQQKPKASPVQSPAPPPQPKPFYDDEPWPELPKDNEKPPKAPFPLMALPKPMQAYCKAVSTAMQTPVEFAALGVLGAIACAIGASTKIEIKPGWQEFAVLWLALCARPGTAKTPALNACFKPIRGIQKELNLKHSQAMSAYKDKMAKAKKDPTVELPVKPLAEFLLLGDITQEALVRTLAESPRGGAILSDELTGWIGGHDKYTGKGNDRQAYLSLWSSLPLSVHRKLDGVVSVNLPVLSVVGGLTPSSLPKLYGGQEDGFLSRFLIACPEERQGVYTKEGISEVQALDYCAYIRKLWELEPEHRDETGFTPRTVILSEDAETLFMPFYTEMQASLVGDALPGILRGSFCKAPSQVARVALILHWGRQVSGEEDDPHRLSADCMDAAILIIRYFLSHLSSMEGLFHIGATKAEEVRIKVILWLKKYSSNPKYEGLPARWHDIRHNVRRIITNHDGKVDDHALTQCLDGLQTTGHIRQVCPEDKYGNKLKPLVYINPSLSQISQ
ncbi:MAG: DUF3987 domain-containing protein [Planctomycetota bacterium]|nr:DUF3987 domain-containing protein [Planctomycetota bacterium]